MRVCVHARVRACACACMRVCVHARVRACEEKHAATLHNMRHNMLHRMLHGMLHCRLHVRLHGMMHAACCLLHAACAQHAACQPLIGMLSAGGCIACCTLPLRQHDDDEIEVSLDSSQRAAHDGACGACMCARS